VSLLRHTQPSILASFNLLPCPQKNCVYYVAKQLAARPCSPEEFGVALARHFVDTYPATVWKAKVAGVRAGMVWVLCPAGWARARAWSADWEVQKQPLLCCTAPKIPPALAMPALPSVEMMPWRRLDVGGQPHDHGFVWQGSEVSWLSNPTLQPNGGS